DGCLNDPEGINLENKILLAIAIRLKAEKFMLSKLTDKSEVDKNQTSVFFDRFKIEFGISEPEKVTILDQVNLMTPENIHFNSFMYEPILDMSEENLKNLYTNIKAL
ncbi:MAG: phage infection protein, partial [bacterium]|nr:phage infection protein [bacterium]